MYFLQASRLGENTVNLLVSGGDNPRNIGICKRGTQLENGIQLWEGVRIKSPKWMPQGQSLKASPWLEKFVGVGHHSLMHAKCMLRRNWKRENSVKNRESRDIERCVDTQPQGRKEYCNGLEIGHSAIGQRGEGLLWGRWLLGLDSWISRSRRVSEKKRLGETLWRGIEDILKVWIWPETWIGILEMNRHVGKFATKSNR